MLPFILDYIDQLLSPSADVDGLGPLRVFRYITVRAGAALVLAYFLSLVFGPRLIAHLRARGAGQIVRRAKGEGAISLHDMHGDKEGTPTMGGLLILATLFISVLLFCRWSNEILLLLGVSLSFGTIGFYDDYFKIVHKNHLGLSGRKKILFQTLIGIVMGLFLWLGDWPVFYEQVGASGYGYLLVPIFKNVYPALGVGLLAWVVLILVSTSNAVNLTDGLDGLAIGVTVCATASFTMMAYFASRSDFSAYLFIPYVQNAGEIVVFGGALLGASLGFLWYNSHPAQIFMGDTGSMLLGGTLGAMALLIKQELLLIVVGGIFVVEVLSVVIQTTSYKIRRKRVFLMAPLHHHYEKLGLHESKIIIRFWTVALLLALIGLATLKIR